MNLTKNLAFSYPLAIGLIISLITSIHACTIKITPEKSSGTIGEEIKVLISVRNQHIPCPLDITASEISVDGGKILSQTDWNKKSATEYEKSLIVKLTAEPKTLISVKRVCDIKTSQTTAQIEVKNNSPSDFKTINLALKETTTKLLDGLGKLHSLRANLETLNKQEKDPKTKKKISDLIAQIDSVVKHSKKFVTQCSLLLKGL
ncbi:MAG: hypothetical protein N2201_06745 [candidate division WOR-3 bacterium]|nr:hypothetical protein [candidate division WOR-3 bacterium]